DTRWSDCRDRIGRIDRESRSIGGAEMDRCGFSEVLAGDRYRGSPRRWTLIGAHACHAWRCEDVHEWIGCAGSRGLVVRLFGSSNQRGAAVSRQRDATSEFGWPRYPGAHEGFAFLGPGHARPGEEPCRAVDFADARSAVPAPPDQRRVSIAGQRNTVAEAACTDLAAAGELV